jgi:hypothetical protein
MESQPGNLEVSRSWSRIYNSTNATQDLRKVYCPPLDDSLFYAVALDYDLSIPAQHGALRKTLDELQEAATVNEAADADPDTEPSLSGQLASRTTGEEHSSSHDLTSATSELSNLTLNGESNSLGEGLEHLSETEKRKYLKDLFPGIDNDHIRNSLAGAGSLHAAVDELLNVAFLSKYSDEDATGHSEPLRGIEAFSEDLRPDRGRKRRNKKKNRTTDSSRTNSTGSYSTESRPAPNVWANASGDVEYICSRTYLPSQVVSSVYHKFSANLPATIRDLAEKEKAKLPPFDKADPIVQMQVEELRENFPDVAPSRIQALLSLARNIPSATYELIEVMLEQPQEQQLGDIQNMVRYAPINLKDEDDQPGTIGKRASTSHMAYGADHSISASLAFGQASAAARRAKSDRLMGGAAAYYASVGHDHLRIAKAESAAMADALVSQQSTRTMIDLHGVSVADGVRIAQAKTQAWYDGLGDAKYVSGGGGPVRAGFQIVTGVGTHSKNNAPRLGPAVAKALVRAGWRVEVGHGEMYVTGKVRK